jgi:hypothetical protein
MLRCFQTIFQKQVTGSWQLLAESYIIMLINFVLLLLLLLLLLLPPTANLQVKLTSSD